jgi:SAM-dependent methyltransferase
MKINLGAGPNWYKEGWHVLDHKLDKKNFRIKGDLLHIKLKNNKCDLVFISHTLEHIPHINIQKVLCEINRIMKPGGTIRILVPDLRKIATAYVKKDKLFFKKAKDEDHSIRTDLGFGGMLMNFIVSPGQDTILLNRSVSKFIAGYAHLYSYDFDMMKAILKLCGFCKIQHKKFCDSQVSDFREPCHILGMDSKYYNLNNKFYKKHNLIHKYINGDYKINFKFTGFDKDPLTSLIVEAKKDKYVPVSKKNDINYNKKNYNNYAFSPIYKEQIRKRLLNLGININTK